jgi:hypothetical protein
VNPTMSHRHDRALDALSLAPKAVAKQAVLALHRSPAPGRWLVVDPVGASFHASAAEAADAWARVHDVPGTSRVAWLIDLDSDGGAGVTGARRAS